MKYLPRATAFGKLKAMAEGAAIVRKELGLVSFSRYEKERATGVARPQPKTTARWSCRPDPR